MAILAGAVVVLGGIAALIRSIWRAAQAVRDNKSATQANTKALSDLKEIITGRLSALESKVNAMELRRRW